MKRSKSKVFSGFLGFAALCMCVGSAQAQLKGDDSQVVRYDSKMEKQPDLRKKYQISPHEGELSTTHIIDHSRMVDFQNILGKRADLRVRMAKVGMEMAYAEWSGQARKLIAEPAAGTETAKTDK